jgi:predicted O-methyltransferase YrrM
MSDPLWTEVDDYIGGLLVHPDDVLDAALRDSNEAGLPTINVSPAHGKMLHLLARAIGARKILEIGTLGGYSTIWLARALPAGGRLITLEAEVRHADIAHKNIARAGLADVVEVRVGRALDSLPQIAAEGLGPFDLIFIDADKPSYTEYLAWALKLSRRGTLLIADNVVRKGRVADAACTDELVRGVRRFNEALAGEPRVNSTIVQTVGSKGYDGFAMAVIDGEP